jgi:crotonobetainyl-CoA:carnitine CoA-transferase CaiB-like acyl-CoA transferase
VNTPNNIVDDPQFQYRLPWIPKEVLDVDMLPYPVKVDGGELPYPSKAPNAGQHTDEVLTKTLGYDAAKAAALREGGVAY